MAKRPRKEPYTEIGIGRVSCCRCGKPSISQWDCCAISNEHLGLCLECDIGLNRVTLEYIGHPDIEKKMRAYGAAKRVIHTPGNSKAEKVARGEALTMRRKKRKQA